jgi:hypothetical protein
MALGLCGLVKQLYRPVCSHSSPEKCLLVNRLLAGFSAVAQNRQLSHTACSLSFAYFNARSYMTTKARVRRTEEGAPSGICRSALREGNRSYHRALFATGSNFF